MTEKTNITAQAQQDESLRLLRKIDGRLDGLESKIDRSHRTAVRHGAVAGGVAGGMVSLGIAFVKAKLGL